MHPLCRLHPPKLKCTPLNRRCTPLSVFLSKRDHINILRKDVESAIDINTLEKNKKYFIIGFCEPYKNKNRMGVKLATGYSFSPIIIVTPVFFITGKTFKNESS